MSTTWNLGIGHVIIIINININIIITFSFPTSNPHIHGEYLPNYQNLNNWQLNTFNILNSKNEDVRAKYIPKRKTRKMSILERDIILMLRNFTN